MTSTATLSLRRAFRVRVLPIALTLLASLVVGALIAQSGSRIGLLLLPVAAVAVFAVSLEAPIVLFAVLLVLLGLASGDDVDSPVPDLTIQLYDSPLIYAIVALLVVALALNRDARLTRWPGRPATLAVALAIIALIAALRFGAPADDLFVGRPIFLLAISVLAGYMLATRYGSDLILELLVGTAGLAVGLGLYNVATGHELSFYDSSFVFLIGVAATLVLFSAVDIGFARFPFLIASALVIVTSLRRGTIIAVAITLLVTGLVKGRGGFRTAVAVVTGVVVALEIALPGSVFDNVSRLVGYFTGGSGEDFSVNYRSYETANAWLNVERNWLDGIGPTSDWILYRTFDGKFEPYDNDYLHNSYLWMWLRYGLIGLVTYAAFIAVSALVFVRRSAPVAVVVIGGSMVGLAFAVATASFLTTTSRWPLLVGLLVGIACRIQHEQRLARA